MSKRILVVEDNEDNMKLVTWILEDYHLEVTQAMTAEAGLEQLQQQEIDLVLMDISLPGMDGKEATKIIRNDAKYHELPVVALTAHAVRGEREAILDSGVNDLVTKPIDEDHFLSVLEKYLGKIQT